MMGIKERKKREREMRRQQIMVAAKRVFTQKGFEKSTVEDIAREAELSPGTLYLYFKSKDELYASLCLRVLRFINVKVDHVISEETTSYEEKQSGLLNAMKDVYAYDPLILNNMFHLQSSDTLRTLSPDLLDEINDCHVKRCSPWPACLNKASAPGILSTAARSPWRISSGRFFPGLSSGKRVKK
jgi:AcrR family transcriptional regulator